MHQPSNLPAHRLVTTFRNWKLVVSSVTLIAIGITIATEAESVNPTEISPTHIYREKIKHAGSNGFDPAFDVESIIIATLPPGTYTIQCRGADGGSGIALLEAYEY